MPATVLLTGGTGLIGTRLTALLQQRGYQVAYLTRASSDKTKIPAGVKTYTWDATSGQLDENALLEADHLIHLAGANLAEGRWTDERKKEIIESRTRIIEVIAGKLAHLPHHIQSFVSASGIAYYGGDTGSEWMSEQYTPGVDFLAEVCIAWEATANRLAALNIRTVKLRMGAVLSEKGGALAKIAAPIRYGFGTVLDSGKQYMSWIHLDDVCQMFIEALENPTWSGAYNAVSPQPVTNEEFTKTAAEVLKKPLWLPHAPKWALKAAFGEMAIVVTGSQYILNQRIRLETDFRYQFPELKPALVDLLR